MTDVLEHDSTRNLPRSARGPANCDACEVNSQAVDREREFFDSLVAAEAEFNPFTDRGWEVLARRFEQMVPLCGPVRMLDVGCGTGQSRQVYRLKGLEYVGVDLSRVALERARAKYPQDTWQYADASALPFDEASFDLVAFSSVLHHIPDFSRPLQEAWRVLRPGGYVFAFDPNLLHPAMALFRHPRSPLYRPEGVSPNERPLLPSWLARALRDAGFGEIRQRCQAAIPYRAVAPRLLNSLLRVYNFADLLLHLSGLGRWLGTFIVTSGTKPMERRGGARPAC